MHDLPWFTQSLQKPQSGVGGAAIQMAKSAGAQVVITAGSDEKCEHAKRLGNATFSTISVENPSRMSHRRINETVGVRYNDFSKLAQILDDIKQMVGNHDEIDNNQIYMVNFNQFGPSSLDFFIYAYTRTTNWAKYHEVKQDVLFQAMQIIEQHGAEVAFPTRTLHLFNEQAQDNEEFLADTTPSAAKPKISAKHSHKNGNENQANTSQVGDAEAN